MSVPVIHTAIPRRRYQLGEFLLTILGDVESGDGIRYRYILAVGREGDPHPSLFVSAEETRGDEMSRGPFRMRISMPDGAQVLDYASRWRELDTFVDEAMAVIRRVLDLDDEVPYRLM